jgi:O-antigen/teichoic acid export membrane protein
MRRISRNFLSLFVSDGLTRVIGFAATVYIARLLAVEGFGLISYGLAFVSYALLFANPGLTVIGAREVAKTPQDRRFIEEVIGLRIVLAIVIFAILFISVRFIPGDSVTKQIIIIYALTLFPFAVLLEFVFQGREEMEFIGMGRILQYGVYLIILLVFLKSAEEIAVVPLAFVFGYVVSAVFLLAVYFKKNRYLKPRFSIAHWRAILVAAIPVGLAIIFNQVTISLPPIVLGIFHTNYEVGVYSAGYKIVFMLLIIDRVFYYVFFPVLAKQFAKNPEKLKQNFRFLTRMLFALTIPLTLGGLVLAPKIINFIYGHAFHEAVGVFRILLLYFMMAPINTIFGYGLIAIDQERRFFKIITITAVMSAVLIIILGMGSGSVGAAWALLIAETISIILMNRELKKFVLFRSLRHMVKPFIAAFVMAVGLHVLGQWSVIASIITGLLLYIIALYSIRGFTRDDLKNVTKAFTAE